LRSRCSVCPDLVDKYLEETSIRYVTPRTPGGAPPGLAHPHKSEKQTCGEGEPPFFPPTTSKTPKTQTPPTFFSKPHPPTPPTAIKPPFFPPKNPKKPPWIPFADFFLRVRAEYCQHESALRGNVFSNKAEALERQFERFGQANTILKSRDLGSIICDIKFSELTYLDAFWRDYINGSLLEALKGVFITDSLKQAVGHEAIKLLVNVFFEDYELGRQKLLRNLVFFAAP
ncbi:DEDD protein, partial [Pteruthius melanotis]|nr:DEDD protein [Pteruthius melanotis]